MKKKVKNNIRSILLKILIIIALVSAIIFIRDVLVKRGVSIVMLTRKDYMNAAEYYMQQKYDENFESEYIYEGSVYVHTKSNPYRHVVVDVETKDGMTYFHDNYVGYLKNAELEKYIYELVKPIYGECKVYTHPYGFGLDDSFNRDTDLMTYESCGEYTTRIFTYKYLENRDEKFKETCNIFINKGLNSDVLRVIYLTKKDFEKLEEKDIDKISNSRQYYYRLYASLESEGISGFSDVDIVKGDNSYGK